MNIPSPYFKDVPGIGNLEMDEIIVEYDYPLLSVLKSKSGAYFLCMCYDVSDAQRWIITPVFVKDLQDLLRNKITLDAPFTKLGSKKILAEWTSAGGDQYQEVDAAEIPERCLPIEGEYLEAEEGEWDEYIAKLTQSQWNEYLIKFMQSQWDDSIIERNIRNLYVDTVSHAVNNMAWASVGVLVLRSEVPYERELVRNKK